MGRMPTPQGERTHASFLAAASGGVGRDSVHRRQRGTAREPAALCPVRACCPSSGIRRQAPAPASRFSRPPKGLGSPRRGVYLDPPCCWPRAGLARGGLQQHWQPDGSQGAHQHCPTPRLAGGTRETHSRVGARWGCCPKPRSRRPVSTPHLHEPRLLGSCTSSHTPTQRHSHTHTIKHSRTCASTWVSIHSPTPEGTGHCHSRRAGWRGHSCPGRAHQLVARHQLPRIENIPCFYAPCVFPVSLCLGESSSLNTSGPSAGPKGGRTGMCCAGPEPGRGPCALWQAGWGVGATTSCCPSTPGLVCWLPSWGRCSRAGVSPTPGGWLGARDPCGCRGEAPHRHGGSWTPTRLPDTDPILFLSPPPMEPSGLLFFVFVAFFLLAPDQIDNYKVRSL